MEPLRVVVRQNNMKTQDRHGLVRRQVALASGESVRSFDGAVREGALVAVDRGVYVKASALAGHSRVEEERLKSRFRCLAGASRHDRDALLTHDSAAALLGMATLHPERKLVHVSTGSRGGGGVRNRTTIFHPGQIPDDDVAVIEGVRVTTLARTAVDVALASDFPRALAAFDSALRLGADRDDLNERLREPRNNVATARLALKHANGAAENPGESWGRAQIIEADLPIPEIQRTYLLRDGSVARVDYDWDGILVGEFDGEVKYRKQLRGDLNPEDVVIAEKLREDMLRELGLDVIRWVWRDLRPSAHGPSSLIGMLQRRLAVRGLIR